jgi:DNA (cytosine-5)-methyltransferase 1
MSWKSAIPVIDLFAGPGGLGEGFAAAGFDIRLSIEKDAAAHRTLELRAYFRQFERAPDAYYEHLRGRLSREELFAGHPRQAAAAMNEAMHAELGVMDHTVVRERIKSALKGTNPWVLIGGPPCQAYSLVGRARNRGIIGYSLGTDPKARLYIEYLRILADHWPAAFVMENVHGLLSAKIDGKLIFDRLCEDLTDPAAALDLKSSHTYTLHALSGKTGLFANAPADYLLRCERYGIPQARHRVIIVGLRNDVTASPGTLARTLAPSVYDAIGDLPKLRSGLSKEHDDAGNWLDAVTEICSRNRIGMFDVSVKKQLSEVNHMQSKLKKLRRGGEFIFHDKPIRWQKNWFHDCRRRSKRNARGGGRVKR